jgi:hypothetical protein
MTDTPTRFTVIEGVSDENGDRIRTQSQTSSGARLHRCPRCSEALGFNYGELALTITSPMEENGQIVGGQYVWVCARCQAPRFSGGRIPEALDPLGS